jgi:hypothetical protein
MMNDVFRITLSQLLDVETQIQLIKLHLTYLQIKTRMRLQKKSHDALIINHCDKIKRKLTQSRERRRRFAEFTSSERKRSWFKSLCAEINEMTLNEHVSTNKELKKTLHKKWKNVLSEYQTINERRICVTLSSRCFKKTLKTARKHDQNEEQSNHANANRSYKLNEVSFSSSCVHRLNVDLFMRLIQAIFKAYHSFLFSIQRYTWEHASRRWHAWFSSAIRRAQDSENSDEMTNENRFTLAIFANNRMSRVISLNHESKTNAQRFIMRTHQLVE